MSFGSKVVTTVRLVESDASGVTFSWQTEGAGEGTITIYADGPGKSYRCANEGLSRPFVQAILMRFLDDLEFDDEAEGVLADFSYN